VRFRHLLGIGVLLTGTVAVATPAAQATTGAAAAAATTAATTYVVLADSTATLGATEAAVVAAGGTVLSRNHAVGMLTVTTTSAAFAATVSGSAGVAGVARNRSIGSAPKVDSVERDAAAATQAASLTTAPAAGTGAGETYSSLQWDLNLIGATATGSYAKQQGKKGVTVGIIDTGIDGKHPDLRANFNKALSRNFVTDIPSLDGPCEHPSCVDPVDEDDDGHGTHTAGTVAAALNGRGVSGIAPNVTLVNIRAGQDSGYFFLDSTIDALTYAGDAGINVVNMSFYTDPWLYNCANNPADSPAEQREQRTIIKATQRALDYAHDKGVVLVSALGNESTDMGHPTFDDSSPDYPTLAIDPTKPGTNIPRARTVDNSCLDLPAEGHHVIGVSAIGPSTRLSFYSNYGIEQTDVSAPGGDSRDVGTGLANPANRVLSTASLQGLVGRGYAAPDGTILNTSRALKECVNGDCGYYNYDQGTSMASPHTVGVVALIVSQYGERGRDGRITMDPDEVQRILFRTATKTPCPTVNPFVYPDTPGYTPLCEGTTAKNGFYGNGIVNALAAVSRRS